MSLRKLSLAVAAFLSLTAALPLAASAAGPVPFKATLVESVVSEGPCSGLPSQYLCVRVTGSGQSTLLGAVTESTFITVDLSSRPAPNCVTETRRSTLTTASGDQITLTGPGVHCLLISPQGTDVHNTSFDSWTATGGTGSLAGATGSGTEMANINSERTPVTSVTVVSGTLTR